MRPYRRGLRSRELLNQGERLANRLMSAFSDRRNRDQLVHIATDGESYGHHHRYGEMALAYALDVIEGKNLAKLTNYGEYWRNIRQPMKSKFTRKAPGVVPTVSADGDELRLQQRPAGLASELATAPAQCARLAARRDDPAL